MKMVKAAKGGTAHEAAPSNPMGYAAATSKPKVEKKAQVERVSMETAENGWTVRVSYKDKPGKNGNTTYMPSKEYVFNGIADAVAFVSEAAGGGEAKTVKAA